MALQWSNDLSTTVVEIDDQQRGLFTGVDGLLAALAQGKGREEMTKVAQFLTDYVVFHFGAEEQYMTKFAYQNAVQRRAQHAHFVKTFTRLKDRPLMEGVSPALTEDAKQLVVDWLLNHIQCSTGLSACS